MEVRVQALVTHLVDLLHIVGHHVLQELLEVCSGVDALQLLLVQIQHFVDSTFELELKIREKSYSPQLIICWK